MTPSSPDELAWEYERSLAREAYARKRLKAARSAVAKAYAVFAPVEDEDDPNKFAHSLVAYNEAADAAVQAERAHKAAVLAVKDARKAMSPIPF